MIDWDADSSGGEPNAWSIPTDGMQGGQEEEEEEEEEDLTC